MVKVLMIVVTLVTLLTDYSYCEKGRKLPGLDKRFSPLNGATNPMQRSYPQNNFKNLSFPSVHPNMQNKRTENDWKDKVFSVGNDSTTAQPFHPSNPNFRKTPAKNIENKESLKSADTGLSKQKRKNLLGKVIQKPSTKPVAEPFGRDSVTASKRVAPVVAGALTKLAANANVQEAVIDKGIEVAGKLIDKHLANIEEAQEKAADFLKKKIKLNITPEKGWETEDMFVPPGYHIQAEVEAEAPPSKHDDPIQPYTYPAGIGSVMMNGCWGTGYKEGDPCFNALEVTKQCRDMIDGAAFIGVGFDGRGQYSPESRKMSIIQRSCGGHSSYDNLQVPDTMNVHGIYDTSAQMTVFTSRSEYQKYLQQESGVSGSFFGFYAGVKTAWGSSESGAQQTNLAIFDIDVDRYEIFQDEVKPQDLSRSFLREFVDLPTSYFGPGAPAKFQDFILRWGTHYIKSARFGGQLELRKLQQASMTASKEEFAVESEVEFKSLFWSAGAKASVKSGSSSKSKHSYMSTSVIVQGGSQRIAAIISDMYSPTFKTEFTAWLESIPTYPKAFKFLMGSVTDLLNFRANDLFPDETIDWGCEQHKKALASDEGSEQSYYMVNKKKVYCEFASRNEMEVQLKRKRVSLKRAIEVYLEEGVMSISDVSLPAGEAGCQSKNPEYQSTVTRPSWTEMTKGHKQFHVMFDMLEDLKGAVHGGIDIPRSMSRIVQYSQGKWYTTNKDGEFHLYDGFNNGRSDTVEDKKISIFGLVLTFDEDDASLILNAADYIESLKYFPELGELLKNKQLARVEWPTKNVFKKSVKNMIGHLPCNVEWSNGLRFDPSDRGGKCLHFTASSKGTFYVVFSAVPNNKDTWYYVEVSPFGVGIYKSQRLQVSTVNTNAVSLGDALLYQSYFVCLSESPTSTVIEYGKSQGTTDSGDVYLTMIDHNQPLHVRFYSFGNGEEPMQVMDSHVVSRILTTTECKGDTHKDKQESICVQKCHEACDPMAGCRSTSQGDPKASECNECRNVKDQKEGCLKQCPLGKKPNKRKHCMESFDLKFKPGIVREHSDIVGFPTLDEFTICFWINSDKVPPSPVRRYQLLEYVNQGASDSMLEISTIKRGITKMEWTLNVRRENGNMAGRFLYLTKDDQWHQFCATRVGNTGETNVFIDGSNPHSNSYFRFIVPGKTPLSGGKMHFASEFPGEISGVNIWDRILTDDEISKMAQSCGVNTGNLKDWFDIKNEVKLSKYIVKTPSTCTTGM